MPLKSPLTETEATSTKMSLADGPPMPEMRESHLDALQVTQLFSDLAACAQILAIQEKSGQQDHAKSYGLGLAVARRRILNREVLAVQIRYRYDNAEWIDTLLQTPAGIRAVRCRMQ